MEFAYLNAVIKTTFFPPYDPWFAGGYLNYYYFGYVLVAALARLTGVMPAIAFNVAVATFYALTASAAFSFVGNLFRLGGRPGLSRGAAIGAGVAGVFLVALVGNLDGFLQLVERLAQAARVGGQSAVPGLAGLVALGAGIPAVLFGGQPLEAFDFWRSSRVIPNNTINEFPFWTFLFADLHPHLMSIPYQVVTLGVLLNLALRRAARPAPGGRSGPRLRPRPPRRRGGRTSCAGCGTCSAGAGWGRCCSWPGSWGPSTSSTPGSSPPTCCSAPPSWSSPSTPPREASTPPGCSAPGSPRGPSSSWPSPSSGPSGRATRPSTPRSRPGPPTAPGSTTT